MARSHASLHGAVPDASGTALLILDMFSDFEFPHGATAALRAQRVAVRIAALKRRARHARIPSIYVNDHHGRWRSDFAAIVRHCERSERGRPVVQLLKPDPDDYRVLKPKHSGFFSTPLGSILQYLGVRRLVVTGSSAQQCILFTAIDAYVRDYQLCIPTDCLVALNERERRFSRYFFQNVLRAPQASSTSIRLAAMES